MDLKYFACILALGLFHGANAQCGATMFWDPTFIQCATDTSAYMANAAMTADLADPTAMTSAMCSTEGKAAMKCVVKFIKACRELLTTANSVAMLKGAFEVFDMLGGLDIGFDAYCNMVNGPCQSVQQCMSSVVPNMWVEQPPWSPPTPFSFIQYSMKGVCGMMKAQLDCLKGSADECKLFEYSIESGLDFARAGALVDVKIPTFEQTKMFVINECPKLPQDFITNTCVETTLKSDAFVKCYEKATADHSFFSMNNQISCEESHKCISSTVGMKCGKKYTDAFAITAPMFMAVVPTSCKLETSGGTDSSSTVSDGTGSSSIVSDVMGSFSIVSDGTGSSSIVSDGTGSSSIVSDVTGSSSIVQLSAACFLTALLLALKLK